MAPKSGNGNGLGGGEVLATLKQILDVQRSQADMLRALREETHTGFAEVRSELHTLNGRFDNLLERASERDREQARRLEDLADRVARLEARGTETR